MTQTLTKRAPLAMQVPLLDLKPQYAALREEILPAIARVLEGQQLINGPEVEELEGGSSGERSPP